MNELNKILAFLFSPIRNFLWYCSTAKKRILLDFPTVHTKHALIGTFVLLTSLLAFFSGTIASWVVLDGIEGVGGFSEQKKFQSKFLIIGGIWAFIIFNVDRLLLSSMRRAAFYFDNSNDRWTKIKYGFTNWGGIALRVLLALVIAWSIAIPVEFYIFKDQINSQKVAGKYNLIRSMRNLAMDSSQLVNMAVNLDSFNTSIVENKKILDNIDRHPSVEPYKRALDACYVQRKKDNREDEQNVRRLSLELQMLRNYTSSDDTLRRNYPENYPVGYLSRFYTIEQLDESRSSIEYNQAGRSRMSTLRSEITRRNNLIKGRSCRTLSEDYLNQKSIIESDISNEITSFETRGLELTDDISKGEKDREQAGEDAAIIATGKYSSITGAYSAMNEYFEQKPSNKIIHYFVFGVFLFFELLPILSKGILFGIGPYDYKISLLEYKAKQEALFNKEMIDLMLLSKKEEIEKSIIDEL